MAEVGDGPRGRIEVRENEPGSFTVILSGELDIQSVAHLHDAVDDLMARSVMRLDFDLADVAFMDSSGLALLLRLTNQFGPADVSGAKKLIRRVIEVSGLTEVLKLQPESA
jgi:anti-sigma B factor antagonist